MAELILKQEVYSIIGAAFEVYNVLGVGFLEAVYQAALEEELNLRKIPHIPQQEILVKYKGKPLRKSYIADIVAYGNVIVEIKAIDHITSRDYSQVLNYLKATSFPLGLLINFGSEKDMEWKRIVNTPLPKE